MIVYMDVFQIIFFVSFVVFCVVVIGKFFGLNFFEMFDYIFVMKMKLGFFMIKMFFFDDLNFKLFFLKQFFGGMFIVIVMMGFDQDFMQKNLICKFIGDV